MANIISGADIIGALDDLYDEGFEVGLPRTATRRARRAARGQARQNRADRILARGGVNTSQLANAAARSENLGQPVTLGTDLIASGQRRQVFGLGSATVTSVSPTGLLSQTAQRPMQPLAVVVNCLYLPATGQPTEGSYLVNINDIKMGTASQLAGVGAVPASYFRPDTVQSLLTLSAIGPGVDVSMLVTGNGIPAGDSVVISASMLCVVAEQ